MLIDFHDFTPVLCVVVNYIIHVKGMDFYLSVASVALDTPLDLSYN